MSDRHEVHLVGPDIEPVRAFLTDERDRLAGELAEANAALVYQRDAIVSAQESERAAQAREQEAVALLETMGVASAEWRARRRVLLDGATVAGPSAQAVIQELLDALPNNDERLISAISAARTFLAPRPAPLPPQPAPAIFPLQRDCSVCGPAVRFDEDGLCMQCGRDTSASPPQPGAGSACEHEYGVTGGTIYCVHCDTEWDLLDIMATNPVARPSTPRSNANK